MACGRTCMQGAFVCAAMWALDCRPPASAVDEGLSQVAQLVHLPAWLVNVHACTVCFCVKQSWVDLSDCFMFCVFCASLLVPTLAIWLRGGVVSPAPPGPSAAFLAMPASLSLRHRRTLLAEEAGHLQRNHTADGRKEGSQMPSKASARNNSRQLT